MSVPAQPTDSQASIGLTNPGNGAQSPLPSQSAFTHGATGELRFSEADIAAARKQEKDKLYPELSSLKEQMAQAQQALAAIEQQKQTELDEINRKQQERDAATQAKKEDEMSAKALLEAKLKETNDTWEERFGLLQQERDNERALALKERAFNELIDYRNSLLTANAEEIAPQFHPFITGDTAEQIDAAIAQAKAATQSIADEVSKAQQLQTQSPRGVSPTGYAPNGPMDSVMGSKQYTPAQINAMSMTEYAKFRQENGMASGEALRSRGILG